MKKQFKLTLAAFAATVLLASCGPKLMTEAEMAQKIDEQYKKETETLGAQLDKDCEARMEQMVQAKVDSIVNAAKTRATVVQ